MRRNERADRCPVPGSLVAALLFAVFALDQAVANVKVDAKAWTPQRICTEIERAAKEHDLPLNTFTRLIWTESRFDLNALSPVGAQGIAQFMPYTAAERGLKNPFDPAQAIPASASLLADLRMAFGNFGLAAAAYNAGPSRVGRWLAGRSSLPFETQDYIIALTGQTADAFRRSGARVKDFSLRKKEDFSKSCPRLPVRRTRFRGTVANTSPRMPWGVDVAGHFKRAVAMRSWTRLRRRLGPAIGSAKPSFLRVRSTAGRKKIWTVRLGARSRKEAIALCKRIRRASGSCLVKKNR